ncbi:MAG: EF-P lysine aminoacylase GenX [Deltaproteobacteria bacterium]|nr:EF-P lysine aminoacylase GenX [Deltaproteobacteria bacterium]
MNTPAGEEFRLITKKRALRLRAMTIQALRRFFVERGYLEVETPHLIPAPAPEAHIDAVPVGDAFLHTSPELCMKRLLAAGYPRLFQICQSFRQGERGARHLPEFTLLEWYGAGMDYLDLMGECEELVLFVSRELGLGEGISYQGTHIALQAPWERLTVRAAFDRYTSMSAEEAVREDRFDEVMVTEIEPHLGTGRPTFLCDYPAELGALARVKRNDPGLAERFELYMACLEIANAFSELTDPLEQRERFERAREERRRSEKPVYPLPEKFLAALSRMPECAGIALGVDRLIMLFADETDIANVVTFTPEEL